MPFDDTTVDVPRATQTPDKAERRQSLVIYHREGVRVAPLTGDQPIVLGRSAPADVVIPEPTLSRRHARFSLVDGVVEVEDLASTNGTWVNGQRVGHARLKASNEVSLGSVSISLHAMTPMAAQLQGIDNHDRFQTLLEHEVDRARTFDRKLGLLMVQSDPSQPEAFGRWCPRVRDLIRSVDRIALYGPSTAEILLPETPLELAYRLATSIVGGRQTGEPSLRCGVAIFPDGASSAEELMEVCRTALRRATPSHPVEVVASHELRIEPPAAEATADGPVISSPAMIEVFETVDRLSRSNIPVLVVGETGTGKEVIARAIHERGPRGKRTMLSINCGAIPDQLIESVLFGHQRGAFTGADRSSSGVFGSADGSTVFLDEIGELSLAAQVALLRVLETKQIVAGATREVKVDVRIIAATHCDLEEMCTRGDFRWDLLYRLNAMVLSVPPLRERRQEIEPLARYFLREANRAHPPELRVNGMNPAALEALQRHDWRGNVRQLRNVIERAVAIASTPMITIDDLPERVRGAPAPAEDEREERPTIAISPADVAQVRQRDAEAGTLASKPVAPPMGLKQRVDHYERSLINTALARTNGNQTAAAALLRMPRRTLIHKMKVHDIDPRTVAAAKDAGATLEASGQGEQVTFKERVERFEARVMRDALLDAGGKPAEAARRLQVTPHSFTYKARKYRLK